MTVSIGDVVAQLREARVRLAAAAVTALRAKADADHAHSCYLEAAQGSGHSPLKGAIDDISVASDKTAKYAVAAECR